MNKTVQISRILLLLLLAVVVSGCVSSRGGDVYTRDEARQTMTVEFGVVEHIRPVLIEGTSGTVGTAAGGIIGGIAGSTVGGGRGSAIATVAGAVAGGVVGAMAEEQFTRKEGVEVTVRHDNGTIRAYVQEADPAEVLQVGERVRVVRRGDTTRVTR